MQVHISRKLHVRRHCAVWSCPSGIEFVQPRDVGQIEQSQASHPGTGAYNWRAAP
jgi:hypothetical protein